jgi:thioredoxin-related protein
MEVESMIRTLLLSFVLVITCMAQAPSGLKYDPKANPKADFQTACARASKEGKHVLMDVGGEWCGWCHRMDKFLTDQPELAALLAKNYVLLKVNFSEENKNEAFLAQYPKVNGYPHLFVFDASGKLLKSKSTGELEEGKGYHLGRFLEFLEEYAPRK